MSRLECQFSVSEDDLSRDLAELLKSKRPYMADEQCSDLARKAVKEIKGKESKELYSGLLSRCEDIVREILKEKKKNY